MAATVITYKRGDKYIKHGSTHGLVGKLSVHSHEFDAIERMDGYVALDAGTYPNSVMYFHDRYNCYVVNPWHDKKNSAGNKAEILIHRAKHPSDLKGCIGPGTLEGKEMTKSTEALKTIWEQCGGTDAKTKVVVTLTVEGSMRALSNCSPYVASR